MLYGSSELIYNFCIPIAGKENSFDTTVISQTIFSSLCVYCRWLIDLLLNQIGKQTPNFACMQLHANMCPRKILRCYKIGEINACTYQYIDQLMVKRLVPTCKDFAGGIRRYTKSSSRSECALLSNYISSKIINKLLLEA